MAFLPPCMLIASATACSHPSAALAVFGFSSLSLEPQHFGKAQATSIVITPDAGITQVCPGLPSGPSLSQCDQLLNCLQACKVILSGRQTETSQRLLSFAVARQWMASLLVWKRDCDSATRCCQHPCLTSFARALVRVSVMPRSRCRKASLHYAIWQQELSFLGALLPSWIGPL